MRKKLLFCSSLFTFLNLAVLFAEVPENYYQGAVGKQKEELQTALSKIISNAGVSSYDGLFDIYENSDKRPDGKVWDIYSDFTSFVFVKDQCGNYSVEGDCFNREHTVPQSWFSKSSPMVSDAFHVLPTDGKVNGMRSNYPFGEVAAPTYVSHNSFSKLGSSAVSGYDGKVFEPNDLYKGDIARIYFYMATRYMSKVGSWGSGGVFSATYPYLGNWTLNLMLKWHRMDPVSEKELSRNDAIYASKQHNRNPFVDYPDLVELIFGNKQGIAFDPANIIPPTPEFKALEATEITHNSFVANWVKQSDADDYEISVYQKIYPDVPLTTLFDVNLSSGKPAGWSTGGYTNTENGGLRLASGSTDGSLTSPTQDLRGNLQLIIDAKAYNTNTPTLSIYLSDSQKPYKTLSYKTNESRIDTILIKGQNQSSAILFKAASKSRVILQNIKLLSGSALTYTPVTSFPTHTGDANHFLVTGLNELSDYFYTIKPFIKGTAGSLSNEIAVTTTSATPIHETEKTPTCNIFAHNHTLYVQNAPYHAQLRILDLSGKLIQQLRIIETEEQIDLPNEGIYILEIQNEVFHETKMIANY